MDIFKLLSRSTKLTRSPSSTTASNLPSAGIAANPQLYHDPVKLRGKKRKRDEAKISEDVAQISDEDVNFFAPKKEKKKKSAETAGGHDNPSDRGMLASSFTDATPTILDAEECRQILRSHRIKVTLLPTPGSHKDEVKKSRKRKSETSASSKKPEAKRLFPQPLVEFSDLQVTYGISKRLRQNLASQGYKIPTEIQIGSLPLLLRPDIALGPSLHEKDFKSTEGVDLLAVAPTGSGKTLAFLIPILNSMIQRRREGGSRESHCLEAIVVAPTKELASQIVNEGRKLADGTGIRVVKMQKGMRVVEAVDGEEGDGHDGGESDSSTSEYRSEGDDEPENSTLKSQKRPSQPMAKADVLVTTPLILLHALSTKSSNEISSLCAVRHLVLDEADVLLDSIFREQTLGIWESCKNPDLRVTLWSATMASNIEALAQETIQTRRKHLNLSTPASIARLVVGLKDSAIPNISHKLIYAATEPGKLIALRQLLHPVSQSASSTPVLRPPFLVFTQTIPRAIALHSELLYDIPAEAGGSSRIAVLHSDLSDSVRSNVMARFRNGEIWVLITTDILSRGVDFRGINGVVNYDIPNTGASYIHRVGRTGRAGRDGGAAVTLYTKEDIPYVRDVANIIAASEKQAGKPLSEAGMQKWLLDMLPKVSKKDKQNLKKHGVEARRTGLAGNKAKISTKSGFERKMENRRKGAAEGSKRRKSREMNGEESDDEKEDSEWDGIGE
ncbi:MAG: RNA-dependent ATPase rok1 [Claussenomyces sp. TS43310]|nr:MAG: RNA-dependent ATPase rok1 [Claussenomyces sp. TS43310]